MPDLAGQVAHEHRVLDGLMDALRTERDDRLILAHRLIDELAAHLAAVTQVLLPALRDIVPGGAEMANQGQAANLEMVTALRTLEQGQPGDAGFEEALSSVAEALGRHEPLEENEQLPALRAVIGDEPMEQLGMVYGQVRENLPSGLDAMPGTDRDPRFRSG
jgi:hypothetical protein